MDEKSTAGKFILDGRIEDRGSDPNSKSAMQRQLQIYRYLFGASILAILTFAGLFTWSLNSGIKQKRELDNMATELSAARELTRISDSLSARLDTLSKKVALLERDNELLIENSEQLDGVFYEVQIGSFTDFDLDNYLEQLANIRQEKYDGKTKLLLGRFRSFRKALLFENDLKKLGLTEVFIVGRIDGRLVPYKEALETQQRENN